MDKKQNEFQTFSCGDTKVTFDDNGYIVKATGFMSIMWSDENQDDELIGKHIIELAKRLKKYSANKDNYIGFLENVVLKFYEKNEKDRISELSNIEKISDGVIDVHRVGRLKTARKSFSEYDFIRLFLSTLLKKNIIKFDSVNLGYSLIELYRNNEYKDLFDMPVIEQIEGDYLDMSSCLANAHLGGLISSPVQGTYNRVIIIPNADEIINSYSEEYKTKMDKLVDDYLLQQEKMITTSGLTDNSNVRSKQLVKTI